MKEKFGEYHFCPLYDEGIPEELCFDTSCYLCGYKGLGENPEVMKIYDIPEVEKICAACPYTLLEK